MPSEETETTVTPPTDDELSALIKPLWKAAKPSREAQSIRGRLSCDFDDGRYPQWISDYIPNYVWDLIDIAAQRGLDAHAGDVLRADRLEQALRELALTANNLLRLTVSEPISDINAWRALSGAVTRALESANAK